MTNEELDVARANEAWRILNGFPPKMGTLPTSVVTIAARLAREGWAPPIDPDLILARKICADHYSPYGPGYLKGVYDDASTVKIAMAAIKCVRGS